MVELTIKGFALDQSNMPLIILSEKTGTRILPIRISPSEARRIIEELEEIHPTSSVSSFTDFFLRHGFSFNRLEIYACSGGNQYHSRIKYHKGFRQYQMDISPGAGLALAVSLKALIHAPKELLLQPDYPSLIEDIGFSAANMMFLHTERDQNYPHQSVLFH